MARPPLGRGPTIVDVARSAGVSVSTVSRVVRDHPDVGAETRARVHAAIDTLGYRPSPIARALVSGQTRLLALLVSDIANPFYPQLAKSVEQAAKRDDYTVIICNTEDRTAETRRYIERLLRQGLDGVIHASAARDEKVLLSLMDDPRRVVFTNRRPSSNSVSYVVSDNRSGAIELTRYLLSRGHRRIGFIAGPSFARDATERLDGFAAALAAGGLRVPQDVALAGFDGVQLVASRIFDLTTVDQHIEQMGRLAVQILLRQLADGASDVPTHEVLPTELLLRGSTEGVPVAI